MPFVPDTPRKLSRSVEDYLKAIYACSEPDRVASTSDVADALDIQPASVTGMIKRLAADGFVEHVPYHGVRLTDQGRQAALRVVRRHRILETYLKERLGYSWDDVHAEAERLEHAASDRLIDRMEAALEHPPYDPHGSPIPSAAGDIEAVDRRTLADTRVGDLVVVRAVGDEDPAFLQRMEALGLVPGARLRVVEAGGGGAVTVTAPGSDEMRSVDAALADRVFVTASEA